MSATLTACHAIKRCPFVLLFALIRWSLLPPWFPETQQWGHRTFAALIGLTYTTFGDELVFYLAVVIAAHAAVFFRRIQRQELEQLALKEALAQSELQTLQMQIQPHFLFNTLNGISSLVHSDAGRAEQMILRLSSLLRRTLKQDGSDLVTLADELRLAEDYLDIEGMRLGSRMAVRWDIQPETRDLLVPQFMFQLLIENGVKHGVANVRGQGWIGAVDGHVDQGPASGRTSIEIHSSPSHAANRSSDQPHSATRRCQSEPSMVAASTSRHSVSLTASRPVSPAMRAYCVAASSRS